MLRALCGADDEEICAVAGDIWALACVLLFLFTGGNFFEPWGESTDSACLLLHQDWVSIADSACVCLDTEQSGSKQTDWRHVEQQPSQSLLCLSCV